MIHGLTLENVLENFHKDKNLRKQFPEAKKLLDEVRHQLKRFPFLSGVSQDTGKVELLRGNRELLRETERRSTRLAFMMIQIPLQHSVKIT